MLKFPGFFQNFLTPGFFILKLLNSRFSKRPGKVATLSVIDLHSSKVKKRVFHTCILMKFVIILTVKFFC